LTDDANDLTKWRFPATNLDAGGFLVVFASGKDRRVAGAPLHTRFKLSAAGEYLALTEPDGVTIATEFAPKYPRQMPDVSFGILGTISSQGRYFLTPTPGAMNSFGSADLGPLITDVSHSPDVPTHAQDLLVIARVLPTFNAVSNVTLHYRIMFSAEVPVAMNDGGVNGDVTAGDGIWSALIPANAATNAQMIRYYVVATDGQAYTSPWPLFVDSSDSEQYLGTVVADPGIESWLPVVHLFVGKTGAAETVGGTRCSLFYLGEFYDNVLISLHGQSSAGWPNKSFNRDFNSDHRVRYGA